LPFAKTLRYSRGGVRGVVDHDGQQERLVLGHQVAALFGQMPLEPEITFGALLGVGGNERDKQRAFLVWPANLLVPGIPPRSSLWSNQTSMPQERRAAVMALRRGLSSARVAQEHRTFRCRVFGAQVPALWVFSNEPIRSR